MTQTEIYFNEKGLDEPGIHWERHITRCGNTDFIKWVKVYEKGYVFFSKLDPISLAAKEILESTVDNDPI